MKDYLDPNLKRSFDSKIRQELSFKNPLKEENEKYKEELENKQLREDILERKEILDHLNNEIKRLKSKK